MLPLTLLFSWTNLGRFASLLLLRNVQRDTTHTTFLTTITRTTNQYTYLSSFASIPSLTMALASSSFGARAFFPLVRVLRLFEGKASWRNFFVKRGEFKELDGADSGTCFSLRGKMEKRVLHEFSVCDNSSRSVPTLAYFIIQRKWHALT